MISIDAPHSAERERVLTPQALQFVAALHERFEAKRQELLSARSRRQAELDAGALPDFLEETAAIRNADWRVAEAPFDLKDRRIEITGPVDRKMMINALNSGAKVFMADFEDSMSPTWSNVIAGQANLIDAVGGTIEFEAEGKQYRLGDRPAVLVVRPRGWHLAERHVTVGGIPISGSLFDFGLYLFHNALRLAGKGTGPYFYLPKLESRLEARLWNDVFCFGEDELRLPRGTIRATVLIETILAAFEMEEILYELREHCCGLNAGRWDYLFSIIKKFRNRKDFVLPDRAQVTMAVPFMRAYCKLLVRTCHRRGAHAIGGMAAFIPSRKDAAVNANAFAKVREDKLREAGDGFDGTWVAHPDLVPVAGAVFDATLGTRPNQLEAAGSRDVISARDLLDVRIPGSSVSAAGVRTNVAVGIRYLDAWLSGTGAAAIFNLMEDAATAEISRAQIWQWIRHGARLEDGKTVDAALVRTAADDDFGASAGGTVATARTLFERVALAPDFVDFLTLPAYELLDA